MLGAIDADDRVTPLGEELARLPAHPRLGRLLLAGARAWRAAGDVGRGGAVVGARSVSLGPARPQGAARLWHACERGRTWSIAWRRCRRFTAAMRFDDPDLELHPGGARNVLRAAEQLFHLVRFSALRAGRAAGPRADAGAARGVSRSALQAARGHAGPGADGRRPRRAARFGVAGPRRTAVSGDRAQRRGRRSAGAAGVGGRARLAAGEHAPLGRGAVLQSDARPGRSPCANVLGRPHARRSAGGDRRRGRGRRATWLNRRDSSWSACCRRPTRPRESFWHAYAGSPMRGPTSNCRSSTRRNSTSCCPRFARDFARSTSCAAPIGSPGCRPASVSIGSRRSIVSHPNRARITERQSARDRVRSRQDAGARGADSRGVRPGPDADDRRRARAAGAASAWDRTTARNR